MKLGRSDLEISWERDLAWAGYIFLYRGFPGQRVLWPEMTESNGTCTQVRHLEVTGRF